MAYLIANDYLPLIQPTLLNQVQVNIPATRAQAEQRAQAEAISMLKQKYDTSQEFIDTNVWALAPTYKAADRVYLTGPAWAATTPYVLGNLILFTDGNIYQCTTANSDATFITGHWLLLGPQYTMYFAKYPNPVFNLVTGIYKLGDIVFWKGKNYTCKQPTVYETHDEALQVGRLENLPYGNIFPDDPNNGQAAWGTGSTYTVPANTAIANATYWTLGDNRDAQMVDKLCTMTLFHLCAIAPQNRPIQWSLNYKGDTKEHVLTTGGETIYPIYSALGWLQGCARGTITPSLPLLQPPSGARIRYGGNVKNDNFY